MVVLCVSNQIFHYTRCNTPKRVTSLRGPSLRHCAWATQLHAKKRCSGGESLAHCVQFDLPRFEPQTSRSRDKHVTARPTGRFHVRFTCEKNDFCKRCLMQVSLNLTPLQFLLYVDSKYLFD